MSGWWWLLTGYLAVGVVLGVWIGFARSRWVFRRTPSFTQRGMFLLGGLTVTTIVTVTWIYILPLAAWRVATDRTPAS